MGDNQPDVELRIPADSAYLAVLRTATAGLAARLDFTLDDIEDLRIAVDEACAMVLPQARPNSDLTCTFDLAATQLTVAVTAECDSPRPPEPGRLRLDGPGRPDQRGRRRRRRGQPHRDARPRNVRHGVGVVTGGSRAGDLALMRARSAELFVQLREDGASEAQRTAAATSWSGCTCRSSSTSPGGS